MSRLPLRNIVLLACTALLFASIGCSSQTGPEAITETDSPALNLHPRQFDDKDPREPFEFEVVKNPVFVRILSTPGGPGPKMARGGGIQSFEEYAEKEIEAETGGIVSNEKVSLYFPPNSLTQNTMISMEMDPDNKLIVECGPHGLQFEEKVMMYLNLEGTNYEGRAHMVDILWLDETTGKWMLIEQLPDLDENHPGALLDHFSKYSGVGG